MTAHVLLLLLLLLLGIDIATHHSRDKQQHRQPHHLELVITQVAARYAATQQGGSHTRGTSIDHGPKTAAESNQQHQHLHCAKQMQTELHESCSCCHSGNAASCTHAAPRWHTLFRFYRCPSLQAC
jgi:hypothetical protein